MKGKKPSKKLVVTDSKTGKKRILKVRKTLPPKCKTPKRICIVCQKNKLRKGSVNYDLKKCQECLLIENQIRTYRE